MNFKKEEILVIGLAVILFLGMYVFIKPSTTGFLIHTPQDYIFDQNLINISDNEIKLIPINIVNTTSITTQTILNITGAMQNESSKLSKVDSLDSESLELKQNEILDIIFSNSLSNNDIISVYLTHNKQTDVEICQQSNTCSDSYSTQFYDGNQKYINFTLNLDSSKNSFSIYPNSDKIKIDYIYATKFTTLINTTITTSYSLEGSIETQDIVISNISMLDYINYSSTLNNQTIDYFYSLDSGNNWLQLIDKNISSLNITKIKLKFVLHSDKIFTPILNWLSINYIEKENSNASQPNLSNNVFIKEVEKNNDILLKIYSYTDLSTKQINITYLNLTNEDKERLKVIDITHPNISFISALLSINYTDDEITNINESTLNLYYLNEITNQWEILDSEINIVTNNVLINLTHFSIYGLFGDLIQNQENSSNKPEESNSEPPEQSSGSSSSSNSGSSERAPSSKASSSQTQVKEKTTAREIPQKQEPKEIVLFGNLKQTKSETSKKTNENDLITTQVVKEANLPKKYLYDGVYLFVILIIILYLIYHKHVKKRKIKLLKQKRKRFKKNN